MSGIGSALKLSITLFWFVMMLICFFMVFFRFAMSNPTSGFVSLPPRSGAAAALADCSFCVDLGAIVCVLNVLGFEDLCTRFLVRHFGGAAG